MTDWAATAQNAIGAARQVLAGAWSRAATSATAQIGAMAQVAAQIEIDYAAGRLTEDEYAALRSAQVNALQGVLSAFEAIGILAAEQAADAAWAVIAAALKVTIPFA